jgi:hypothetical protein
LLERCGGEVRVEAVLKLRVEMVFVGKMWMTGSGGEGCCWKIGSNVFEFGGLLWERCG